MPLEVRNTLSSMCKESKRHCKCIPPTSGTFINYVFSFLKVLHFFMEKHFISLRTLGRASRGIIYGF
jgi:hypothetical protein